MDLLFSGAAELARRIAAGELRATELMEAYLGRIEAENPRLNAIVTLDRERALVRAREADQALARGESWGPLHGVPFTLKDSHSTAGVRTTVGAKEFEHFVPEKDGTVALRLKAAGAILLGKTNVPPMLMSAQTNNPIFGRTNNPWNLGRTVGGSSGGAGAAVAAGLTAFDIGSDMSGSIRMPAHFCGVFGFKPTAHRIPNTGHIPPPPGLPQPERLLPCVGPIARSVEDLALLTRILAGPNGVDLDVPPIPWREAPRREPSSLRIAYLPVFPGVPTSKDVRAVVARFVETLANAGVTLEETNPGFTIEALNETWTAYFQLLGAVLNDLYGFSMPVKSPEGREPKVSDWARVLGRRDELVIELEALFSEFDAFLCPASICTAFEHSPPRSPIPIDGENVDSRYIDHYLYPWNFTGSPAVVVPAGLAADGLPVGVELVGARWGDERLLAVAAAVSRVTGGYRAPPPRE